MSTTHQQALIDQLMLRLVSLSNGSIQTLLDNVFTFLRQRSDFFHLQTPDRPNVGFLPGQAESILLTAFHKQWAIKAAIRLAKIDPAQNPSAQNLPPAPDAHASASQKLPAACDTHASAGLNLPSAPDTHPTPENHSSELPATSLQDDRDSARGSQAEEQQSVASSSKSLSSQENPCRDQEEGAPCSPQLQGNGRPECGGSYDGESPRSTESGLRERTATIDTRNGGRTDMYFWGQTAKEVEVEFPLRRGTLSKDVRVRCGADWLTIVVPSCRMNLAYSTMFPVIADELTWELERKPLVASSPAGGRSIYSYSLIISLTKTKVPSWWTCVFKEDEHKYPPPVNMKQEIAYQDLDLEGQLGVQQAMQRHQTKKDEEELIERVIRAAADKPNSPWAQK